MCSRIEEAVASCVPNRVTMVTANDGPGKTTQIPKALLHRLINDRSSRCSKVLVAHPRRPATFEMYECAAIELDAQQSSVVGNALEDGTFYIHDMPLLVTEGGCE